MHRRGQLLYAARGVVVVMVLRYSQMSVKHLQLFADQLIFAPHAGIPAEPQKTVGVHDTESPTSPKVGGLRLVVSD